MKNLIFLFLAFLLTNTVQAQDYQEYHWKENRTRYPEEEHPATNATMLLQHIQYEYTYANSDLFIYHTVHEIVRVNNDEAVSQNNRIYIPMQDVVELMELHARTISRNGMVSLLDQNNIKEVADEETGQGYKIFAIEGAEVGSEIEYYYTKKTKPNFFGRQYFQSDIPVKKAEFKLICPANLQFEFKSYSGFPEVEQNKSDSTTIYEATDENISPLKKEEYAIYNENRKRIEFRMAYNAAHGKKRLFTWEQVGKQVTENAYNLEKKETKDLQNWLHDLPVEKLANEREKAAMIEDKIKKEFYVDQEGSQSNDISVMLSKKIGSKYGIFRFMVNAFATLGIDHQIVLTNDRSDLKFDGDFESYNYLVDYLIYLPASKDFIAPYNQAYRIGLTPAEFTANEGLFIHSIKVQGYDVAVAEVGEIPALPYESNFDNLKIIASFDESLSAINIDMERSFTGYTSSFIKASFPYMESEDKDKMLTDIIRYVTPDADIEKKEFIGLDDSWNHWDEPLVIHGEMRSEHFIEKAGNTLLFKVGDLIGAQSELYQENQRTMPVVNEYNRGYLRTITVDLPKGYEIQNPSTLSTDVFTKNEAGERIYTFTSNYEIIDGKLVITIHEYYNQIYYPKEKFQEFRKVINAAADFNKIVLVMKKAT